MKALAWIVVGLTWLAGIAATVYLGLHNHPWLATLVLLCSLSATFKSGKTASDD